MKHDHLEIISLRLLVPVADSMHVTEASTLIDPEHNLSSRFASKKLTSVKHPTAETRLQFPGPRTFMQRIEAEAAARNARLLEERQAKEAAQLSACTFQPQPHKPPRPQSARPVLVRGLDKFLDQMSLAEMQRSDKKERMQRLSGGYSNRPLTVTIPRPFQFSN
jgi:hypothetical protein